MLKSKSRIRYNQIGSNKVEDFVKEVFDGDVHVKRVLSLSNAVLGIITSASLSIALIGKGLAYAKGTLSKHGIKQVDRLLSNIKFNLELYFSFWVSKVIGQRLAVVVALDWTDFDADNHATIALYLVTKHGRATPLIWKTYDKSTLKNNRKQYEQNLLSEFKKYLPNNVSVTVVADRGFGYVEFYDFLDNLGFNYVIRFKSNIEVTNKEGETRLAKAWVPETGRAKKLLDSEVTQQGRNMPVVICVKEKKMKDCWTLASNCSNLKTREIINLYAKRWSIETKFRDQKNLRFGLGLYNVKISSSERRDRLLFLAAMSDFLLTVLGEASEALGYDRTLKANTVKYRTHSLFNQGLMLFDSIPNMPEERLKPLLMKFNQLLEKYKFNKEILSFC